MRNVLLNTTGLIEDIYSHNSDGLGIMYHTTHGVKVVKLLPKTAAEARKAIEALPTDDREVAIHWRMRTHGNIDKENCHPYPIGHGAWLMHNGVLHTGNKADQTKSDTWHFAKNYLSTLDADVLHNPQYLDMLGEFIENNRFVIMTADGRMSWVNEDQGIKSNGVVFSNTYAWSPGLLIPGYRSYTSYYPRNGWMNYQIGTPPASPMQQLEGIDWDNDCVLDLAVDEAITAYNDTALSELMTEDFTSVCAHILDNYLIDQYQGYRAEDNTDGVNAAVDAWLSGEWRVIKMFPVSSLVHALLFCCDLTHIDDMMDPDLTPMESSDEVFEKGAV